MLHLSTRNGPMLMDMIANVMRNESKLLVILMGRAIESSLAGLLHHADNDADGTESQTSSMTVSSMAAPSIPACIPLPSGVDPCHEVRANEETASQEDHTSLGLLLRRQSTELSWGVGSQISSSTLSLPCSISSGSTFATCRPPLSLSCVSSLTNQEWGENESKVSSLTTPSGLADGVGSESKVKTSLITAPFKSTIRSSTTPSMVLEVPLEPLQSMLPNAHKCSVCLKKYRPSEEYMALTRQLCPKCNTMHFPRIAPPLPSIG